MNPKKRTDPYILNCEIRGRGAPLVLIHGVAGSLHIWDYVATQLATKNQVIRVDLLGYGHSPKPYVDYTPREHIESIRDTLKKHKIFPPYTLIGLSMGVNLALEFAARYPNEVGGFVGIGFPYYADKAAARAGLHNNLWTRLAIEHPIIAPIIVPPIWWLGLHNIIPTSKFSSIYSPLMAHETLLNPYRVFKSSLVHCMVNNPQTELLEKTKKIPKLFIHGDEDTWASTKDVKKAIKKYKNIRFQSVKDSAHNVVVLKPEKAVRLIRSYLKNGA